MRVLITGGAGFLGVNAALRFLAAGHQIAIIDDFSRKGSRRNATIPYPIRLVAGSVLSLGMEDLVRSFLPDAVLHLAAQVAVTTSLRHPKDDFETNAFGTLNVLEAVRKHVPQAIVLYTSTNKVYGDIGEDEHLVQGRYWLPPELDPYGMPEHQPVRPITPYGCSKACADQYVQDYARTFGLRTVVFRCSCIYGPYQNGTEDQGWVAHFARSASMRQPVTIYGDGHQVRDVLWVDDLCAAFEAAIQRIDAVKGQVFNIGGGPANTLSLLELIGALSALADKPMEWTHADWRPGDQRVYISDIRKAKDMLGWEPTVSPADGVKRLWDWIRSRREET